MKARNIIGLIVRILIGLVFVASAVTKYISIDAFDQFVYEHQLFSWTVTTIVTRLLIAAEFALGVLLLVGLYSKTVKTLIITFLAGFSIYILLKPTLFNVEQENCHCFGTVLILNDSQTLIKNIVLLALSYFMFWNKGIERKQEESQIESPVAEKKSLYSWIKKNQRYSAIWICAVSLILSLLVIMPDTIQYKLYGKAAKIDETKFKELVSTAPLDQMNIMEGKKIVCMYSPVCKFCRKTAMRLDVMRQKYNIDDSNFVLIFWGKKELVDLFFVKTKTKVLPHEIVHPRPFLEATKHKQPVIILLNNGKVEKLLKYPNIKDEDIVKFIKN